MEQAIVKKISAEESANIQRVNRLYREQSYMWRALALMQIPTTFIALVVAIVMYVSSNIIVDVKPRPAPGYFLAEELPEQEFIKYGIEFVNLISSYQPMTAKNQFNYALNFLQGEYYSIFKQRYLEGRDGEQSRLMEIDTLQRAQMFFINRDLVTATLEQDELDSRNDRVIVRIPGEAYVFLGGQLQANRIEYGVYYLTLQTIPTSVFNKNGISIIDVRFEKAVNGQGGATIYSELERQDMATKAKAKRKRKPTPFTRYEWQ